ncbi:DUF7139 domain-containing protein [Halospeciosus flavus]|uniref:Uncharacterized protein n=1 Tax=Halospeciosus flavus TaxID=3032283 RepID=A0ABD5Z502_9EURY|nr:hypothetical protein [Halospeciosus flavus]
MTSLADAYDRRAGEVSRRRVYAGTGLFAAGALMVVAGVVVGTTGITLPESYTMTAVYGAREQAVTLVGLGVPAAFLGIYTVLPANRVQRGAAAVGGLLTVAGIALFRSAYPYDWFARQGIPSTEVLTLVAVYSLGMMTVMWCLFTAIATFKRRNDPGGTVTLTMEQNGETRTVEVPREELDDGGSISLPEFGAGGVGVFGTDVQQDAESNQPGTPGHHEPVAQRGSNQRASSDGGTAANDISSPLDSGESGGAQAGPDRYCGNCAHFDYVRTENGIQPYCGLDDELMDDVEACDEWTPNHGD